jgi:hypothetical protein
MKCDLCTNTIEHPAVEALNNDKDFVDFRAKICIICPPCTSRMIPLIDRFHEDAPTCGVCRKPILGPSAYQGGDLQKPRHPNCLKDEGT